jgi:hypothetical protein
MILRGTFPQLTDSLLANLALVMSDEMPNLDQAIKLFRVETVEGKSFVNHMGVTGVGRPSIRPEGTEADLVTRGEKPSTQYTFDDYCLYLEVSDEAAEDIDKRVNLKDQAYEIKEAHVGNRDECLCSVLNNGFSSAYTGFDSVALFSTAHPRYGLYGGTQANRPTTGLDFSITALQTGINAVKAMTNDEGFRKNAQGMRIVHPYQLTWIVEETIGSPDRPDTSDRSINAINRRRMSNVELINLTDSNAWFIFPADNRQHKLFFMSRKPFNTIAEYYALKKTTVVVSGERFDFGWSDWFPVYGSPGSS